MLAARLHLRSAVAITGWSERSAPRERRHGPDRPALSQEHGDVAKGAVLKKDDGAAKLTETAHVSELADILRI